MKNSSPLIRRLSGTLACGVLAAGVLCAGLRTATAGSSTLSFSAAWSDNQSAAAFKSFEAWVQHYSANADANAKAQMLPEGLIAAKARRAALATLIQTDPEKAIQAAVPAAVRATLPAEIAAQLETRVSGIGDYTVVCPFPAKNSPAKGTLVRTVKLEGKQYRAFVYGRRAAQTSKFGIALQGIAVDDALALSENSLRQLEPNEAVPAGSKVIDLSNGAAPGGAEAAIDGNIYRFGSLQQLQEAEARLEANEAGYNPQPKAAPDAVLKSVSPSGGSASFGEKDLPTPWTTGLKNVLIIRVDFSDAAGDPIDLMTGNALTAQYVQNIADTQVAPYYPRSSFGLTSLTNTVTTNLYRMPQPAASYATAGDNDQLHLDARTLAAADYALTNYERIIVVFAYLGNVPGSFINYGGLAQLGGTNVWINGEFDFRVVTHELGHTYGLFHAGLWQVADGDPISPFGGTIEYGDDFDTMGGNGANTQETDFNPYYKNLLGWINDGQVRRITTNGVYRVYAFDWANSTASTNEVMALTAPKDSQRMYWIGVRRNFSSNQSMYHGAYIIWGLSSPGAGGGGGFLSDLLDMNTPGFAPLPNVNSDIDAALGIDQNFRDIPAGLNVTPIAEGGNGPNYYVDFQIGVGGPKLLITTNYIVGGNGNGILDINECNDLYLVLTNVGALPATNVQVTITSTNAGVFIPQPITIYDMVAAAGAATNETPFKISLSPSFVCGAPVYLIVTMKADTGSLTTQLRLPTGSNGPLQPFFSFFPAMVPDYPLAGTNSPIFASGVSGALESVSVSLYLTHPFSVDLILQLIGPDSTVVTLTRNHGSGQNYGLACSPEASRTTFDDAASNSIVNGRSPFVGSYRPEEPLAAFAGKSGTNVNGIWQLRAIDTIAGGVGILNCWSLNLRTAQCSPGGGQCPGVDLALSMVDAPDPAVIGSNMVYTLTVTNNGPNDARGVVITHNLPGSMQFVSAVASQGGASYAGGVVTAALGNLGSGSAATVTIIVTPTQAGIFFSSANVASTDPELNPLNNIASTSTIVVPPVCDLAVGLFDFPDPTIVGGPLTYTVAVTNKGPAVASGVVVSNVLPAGVRINSVETSQGSHNVLGNVVLFNAGLLQKDAYATASISVTPQVFGVLTATAQASAIQPDPFLLNNMVVASTTIGQAADLALSIVARPDPVVVTSNLTYLITITNLGPNSATNVVVNESIPIGFNISQIAVSQGTYQVSGGSLICNLGTIISGGTANVRVVGATTRVGTLTSTATVTSSQSDPNSANNSASASAEVSPPFVNIVAAGATLTAENLIPANGSIDLGETVTIQFRLQNAGNVPNTNLVATLLATGGVTAPSAPQTYGILRPVGVPGGVPVSRPFTFTASGAAGSVITATLQLQDATSNLPPVLFTFALPKVSSFTNATPITIPQLGQADPYPSTIAVSGVTGQVGKVAVTLRNLTHSYPHDVSALLVGPTGVKTLLLSHAADVSAANNVTLTFDDAADAVLPETGELTTGSWKPSSYPPAVTFPSPAPGTPYSSFLADFNGLTPNGTWSLFVLDDTDGDAGNIANGWSLTLSSVTPVNQLADVGLSVIASPEPVLVADLLTNRFTVTNAGPATATGVTFSNTLPGFVNFISAGVSQGNWTTNGNVVLANFATLPPGASATLTLVLQPQVGCPAVLTNTGYVSAFESDIHIGDNRATAFSSVHVPAADLAVGISASPNPVIVGSNISYTISVTNNGPGNALNVALNAPFPAGTLFGSAGSSQGSVSASGGALTGALGTLAPGAVATVTLNLIPTGPGLVTNTVSVSSVSTDSVPNNSASAVVTVNNPAAIIVPGGATIVTESLSPPNGTIEAGERVTVSFALANIGVLDTANLTATLLASGGVTAPTGPVSYGIIPHGGGTVARSFSFTASSVLGGVLVATLQLQDGIRSFAPVTFSFNLPVSTSYISTNRITIPDHGSGFAYPSAVLVSGLTGIVGRVTVTLNGLTHSFPSDVNVLLAGPGNTDVLLMSHNGGGFGVTNLTLTFDDSAPTRLPTSSRMSSGNYQPSFSGAAVVFPPPAPLAPFGSAMAIFNGINPNGTWALYVFDDSTGDAGMIDAGWTLNLTTIQPVNPVTDVGVEVSGVPASINLGAQFTCNFIVANNGSADAPAVVLTDTLPAGFSVINSTISQGVTSTSGSDFRFEFGTLAAGSTATATLTLQPSISGNFINTASLSGGYTDLNLVNDAVHSSVLVIGTTAPTLAASISGGLLHLTVHGESGQTYIIQASGDLSAWSAISTNTAAADGTIQYTDPNSSSLTRRFYRAVRQ